MITLSLAFCSSDRPDCLVGEEVILELLDPTLLAINDGLLEEDYKHYISGEIKQITGPRNCGYVYVIEYDENLLVDPLMPLVYTDIRLICCASCYIEYAREILLGDTPAILINKDSSILGSSTILDPYSVNISTDLNNEVTPGTDGGVFAEITRGTISGGSGSDSAQVAGISLLNQFDSAEIPLVNRPSVTITNPSLTRDMIAFIASTIELDGIGMDATQSILIDNQIDPGTGVFDNFSFVLPVSRHFPVGGTNTRYKTITIPPSTTRTIRSNMYVLKDDAGGSYIENGSPMLNNWLNVIAVHI